MPAPSSKPALEDSKTIMKASTKKDMDAEIAFMKANLSSMVTDEA